MAKTIASGGGIQSRVTQHFTGVSGGVKQEPKPRAANVEGVAQQGAATAFTKRPLFDGAGYSTKPMPASGVPGYFNAAKAGPGSGRTIMPSGTQSHYGPNAPNATNRAPDPPATAQRGPDILKMYGPERGRG